MVNAFFNSVQAIQLELMKLIRGGAGAIILPIQRCIVVADCFYRQNAELIQILSRRPLHGQKVTQ